MYNRKNLVTHLTTSSVWSLSGQIFATLATLLHISILSRFLPPEQLGTYMLTLSIVMTFGILGMFGLPETMVRNIAKDFGAGKLQAVKETLLTTFKLLIFISLFTGMLIYFVLGEPILSIVFNVINANDIVLLMACWMTLHCIHVLIGESFRGFHNIKYAVLFSSIIKNGVTLLALGACFLVSGTIDLNTALLTNTIGLTVAIAIGVYLLPTRIPKLPKGAGTTHYQDVISQATPLFLDTLAYQVFLRVGLWVLGSQASKEEVALYGAVIQLVTFTLVPLKIVNSILPPIISDMYFNNTDHRPLERTIRTISTIAALPLIGTILLFIFFGDSIMAIIFGDFYASGQTLLLIVTLGYATDIILGPTGYLLKMTQNQKTLLKINLLFGALTVVITIFAAQHYGALGVALSTTVVLIAKNIYTLRKSHDKTGVFASMYYSPKDLAQLFTSLKSTVLGVISNKNT